MIQAQINHTLSELLPSCRLGLVSADVLVEPSSDPFVSEISRHQEVILQALETAKEGTYPIIQESRHAYKLCGKEPSRYRPSAEALLRRLRTKRGLYWINNVVDAINLISIKTHYSIGGFDADTIQGTIELAIGDSTPYEAIGRGVLNIEYMPGLKDAIGFFGTPTSDSERTMVRSETTNILLVFYDFFGNEALEPSMEFAASLFKSHCYSNEVHLQIVE